MYASSSVSNSLHVFFLDYTQGGSETCVFPKLCYLFSSGFVQGRKVGEYDQCFVYNKC